MSNWIKVKLGDIVELKRESYHPKPDEVLPYIGLEHIGQGTLRLISVGKSNEVTSTKSYFSKGDILFGKLRPYFRKVVRPKFNGVCSTDILVLTSKNPRKFNQTFLFYLMASQEMIDLATASSSGTKMPRADWKVLQNLEISIPEDVNEQERIGKILETIDDKIDINIRMNKTLEEMAMTLYKHWFVDFGPFQDEEFVESELGMIPKGWKVIQVKDLGEVITGKTPSTKVKEYYGDKIPFIKIPDMHGNVYIVKTETMLSELGAQSQKNKMLPPNTVCVSCIATPGLVVLTSEMSQTNQQINSVVCKEGVSPYFVYLFFKSISDNIVTLGSGGTATLNLNKGDFSRIKLLMPTNEVMTGFNNKVESIFNLIKINSLNNIELENLRDYLLPRLLSGEIDVSKAEKQVEEVL
uniref:Restriction modification system DNA specificity domain protein n=1 Tax=Geobacillus sp. (strain Y4.1MC1) TaxID=581103 RepID=A0A7U4DL55_GEOS0